MAATTTFEPKRVDELAPIVPHATMFLPVTPTGGPSGKATLYDVVKYALGTGAENQTLTVGPNGSLVWKPSLLSLGTGSPGQVLGVSADGRAVNWINANAEALKAMSKSGIVLGISDTPPATPGHGDLWVVGGGTATGDWVGQDGKLAIWDETANKWVFEDPAPGSFRFFAGDQTWCQYGNQGWVKIHSKGYDQTFEAAGWVRDQNGNTEGIAGSRGTTPGKIAATIEFTREDASQAADPEDCVVIHDAKRFSFSAPTPIKNVADPVDDVDAVNKKYVDAKVASVVGGISHGVAVDAISNTPPTTPSEGHEFIIGTAPAAGSAWVGHANKIAVWHNGAWVFTNPDQGDTHLVEDERANYSWNGTQWVKISELNPALNDVLPVGSVIMWCTGVVPANYLECNGSTFSQAAFPDLYRVLGRTTLPDLRGKFIRGAGPGRAALSAEDWKTGKPHQGLDQVFAREIAGHTHGITGPSQLAPHGSNTRVAWEGTQVGKWQSESAGGHWHHIDFRADWDSETCPNNVALVFCIKARNA